MHKAFPLPVIKFPLAEEVPTVIEFGDSYVVLANTTDTTGGDKSGRTLTLTAEDMQRKKNDAVILKTFGGNEATKKTKKNLLKQQYGNFKAEGSKTLEQTFNRLQVIVSQLQFMDVEIKKDDLNQKFFTSLAPEWLMHTIVWRNRSDLDTMSLDDLYNHLKWHPFTLAVGTSSASGNFITGSGDALCILFPTFHMSNSLRICPAQMLRFSEWLELHDLDSKVKSKANDQLFKNMKEKFQWVATQAGKLSISPPPQLSAFGLSALDKKRKRSYEIIKEVFVMEDIVVDGMHMNVVPPLGVLD
nr:hypothetical protein [Tanacetum cinerariifolium]